jgi:NAD-dependent dihydropyrimidine dehydrogenase PreA subunit
MPVAIDPDKCDVCCSCVDICAVNALTHEKDDNGGKGSVKVETELCADCGACLDECRHEAIKQV